MNSPLSTLDIVHAELEELAQNKLPDGSPAFLFRGERARYPHTLSSLDRHYHDPEVDSVVHDELSEVTAFAMMTPLPSRQLPAQLAGAFAQHYGLPTQVFDFTSSPRVAINFAANRPWHAIKEQIGAIGILDVSVARAHKACTLFDLRPFPEALRARRQEAWGLIHTAFTPSDFEDLKDPAIAQNLGLKWVEFDHLPDDETYLHLVGAATDLTDTAGDSFASLPQEMIDEFVLSSGLLSESAARILSRTIPAMGRSVEANAKRWSQSSGS